MQNTINSITKSILILLFVPILIGFNACGGSGGEQKVEEFTTVKDLKVGPLDKDLAAKGQSLYEAKCTACHKFDERFVGPPLRNVVKKRSPEYIVSMISSPDKMLQSNDTTKALLKQYMTQMTNQNVSVDDARAIFEYLRQINESK